MGLCVYIGAPIEVTVRREVMDTDELLKIFLEELEHSGNRLMCSCSYREGIRLNSSDIDMMIWNFNFKVIADISLCSVYDLSRHTIILMEDSDIPPGFVRLRLLSSPPDKNLEPVLFLFNDGMYVSKSRWRQNMLTAMTDSRAYDNTKTHGPCVNCVHDVTEFDFALCFHSPCWSPLTDDWRKRCSLHNWPPNYVLEDIIKHDCQFVPVGSIIVIYEDELEWRMSF